MMVNKRKKNTLSCELMWCVGIIIFYYIWIVKEKKNKSIFII